MYLYDKTIIILLLFFDNILIIGMKKIKTFTIMFSFRYLINITHYISHEYHENGPPVLLIGLLETIGILKYKLNL